MECLEKETKIKQGELQQEIDALHKDKKCMDELLAHKDKEIGLMTQKVEQMN